MLSTNRRRPTRKYLVSGVVALAVLLLAATSLSDPGGGGALFLTLLLIPGLIGGAIALAILATRGGPSRATRLHRDDPFAGGPLDVINYSRLRVAGLGGLGLVAMAAVIAYVLPRVGQTLELGLAGGVLAAVLVVLYRRKVGPLSTHDGPRGNAFLVPDDDDDEPTPDGRKRHPRSPNRPLQTGASV